MITVPLNADVECTDGLAGDSVAIIVDPESLRVTHVVVKERGRPHTERLVRADKVVETKHDTVRLNCTRAELAALDSFIVTEYRQVETPRLVGEEGAFYSPDVDILTVERERVPAGERVVRKGFRVEATDGEVGQVDDLLLDEESGQITHFVLREGHFWGRKDVIMPLSVVDRTDKEAVYLALDKQTVASLLAIPVKQRRGETNIELFILTFEVAEAAEAALAKLKPLAKGDTRAVLNAALLVKDADGKPSLKEIEELDKRHGALFGAITGGLIGLVGGPAGAVIGAIAGAATGGVAADWIDLGFPDAYLKLFQEGLEPGSAVVLALVENKKADGVAKALADFEEQLVRHSLTAEMVEQLGGTGAE